MNRLLFVLMIAAAGAACSSGESTPPANAGPVPTQSPQPTQAAAAASNQFTEADIAKLKWLAGTWRGMDGEKPFYQRTRFEGTTMVVETFADGTMSRISDTARFELKDGEFGYTIGEQRSAASTITDTAIQFVPSSPVPGSPAKGTTFRFERESGETWRVILEMPASAKGPASVTTYKMEPWKAPGK